MNDEIKEILSLLNSSSWSNEAEKIEDYITNLQQDTEMYAQLKDEYEEEIKDLQQENERLKELCDEYEEEHSNEFKIWKEERHELLDYKSRCEKASECIKKDTRWFDSEYASIYGELCDCAGAKGDRLEVMVNPSNALNILQNGGNSQ